MTRVAISRSARTLAAGALCLAVLAGMIVTHAWPLWTGRDVLMPANVYATGRWAPGEYMNLSTPADILLVDSAGPAPGAGRTPVKSVAPWPTADPKAPPDRRDRRLRGRVVYVQLEDRGGEFQPVTVSLAPVNGAVNLRGIVDWSVSSGETHVSYGIDAFYLGESQAEAVERAVRDKQHVQIQIAIASSGRARIRHLLIDGHPVG